MVKGVDAFRERFGRSVLNLPSSRASCQRRVIFLPGKQKQKAPNFTCKLEG
uniref:Uncharacterized protein n=1 Tax=Anguilla anguilla TaxID=7936 RepID=A0A0E9RC42_ANGAN